MSGAEAVQRLVSGGGILWHQGAMLHGVRTPGASDARTLIDAYTILGGEFNRRQVECAIDLALG
jgi:hypothetical protein